MQDGEILSVVPMEAACEELKVRCSQMGQTSRIRRNYENLARVADIPAKSVTMFYRNVILYGYL